MYVAVKYPKGWLKKTQHRNYKIFANQSKVKHVSCGFSVILLLISIWETQVFFWNSTGNTLKSRMELLGQLQALASAEVKSYLSLQISAEFEDNPLGFWQCHEHSFLLLSKVAEVYLGMSASSVPVECICSE